MGLALQELDYRRPVWEALSELFLDTQIDQDDLRYIAERLAESKYSVSELEQILRQEVGPAVAMNMFSVAGLWEGFDQAWMERRIIQQQTTWRRWIPRYTGFRLILPYWVRIRQLLGAA